MLKLPSRDVEYLTASVRFSAMSSGIEDSPTSMARLALSCSQNIALRNASDCYTLISCTKSKAGHRDRAQDLYTSPLFRKSLLLTRLWQIPFSVLSAKYGLVDSDEEIDPYEQTLKGATPQVKSEWAANIDPQIRKLGNKHFIVLAGDDYFSPLQKEARNHPIDYYAPMAGLSLGSRLSFLNEAIRLEKRRGEISKAYQFFEAIAAQGFPSLQELLSENTLPSHGVYFFFDDNEQTTFSSRIPRLVRIGTHGVSAGSAATLRNRLRAHLGTKAGSGNHRASVFRLHVGRAMIERDGLNEKYPYWGKGQSAPLEITRPEIEMENAVSEYIGSLRVLFIPVLDPASKTSMRATIERQFIALFTEKICPLDSISINWLGRFSDKSNIRESGLWNVRDVGESYDLRFLNFFDSYLNKARLKKS